MLYGTDETYCEHCDRYFPHPQALFQHYNASNQHICLRCNFRFETWDDLLEHRSVSDNHAECEDCQIDFPGIAALRQHFVDDPDHHYCWECKRHFDTPNNLTAHSRKHLPRNISCFGCDIETFPTYSAMLIHLESGNCNTDIERLDMLAQECFQSKKYVVPEFRHWLSQGARLNGRAEVWESPYEEYECSICDKYSETPGDIVLHTRSPVHDPDAFRCPSCDQRFKVLSALVQHVESDRCPEGINNGTRSIGKMLHYLCYRL